MSGSLTGTWDMHAHLVPATVIEAARRGELGLSYLDAKVAVDGRTLGMDPLGNPQRLLTRIEQSTLDGAVVSVPPPFFRYGLDAGDAARWTELVNTGLAQTVADSGGRIAALAYLPMGHPELAAKVAADLGPDWVGAGIGPPPGDGTLADDAFGPVWTALESTVGYAFFHPTECGDARIRKLGMENLVGAANETGLAAAALVFGDVIGRHPGLRFGLSHGGGPTAVLIGRWQRAFDTGRVGAGLLLSPRDAAKKLIVDSVVHSPEALALLRTVFGTVMLGTDWPFPMAGADPLENIPAELRTEICAAGARLREA